MSRTKLTENQNKVLRAIRQRSGRISDTDLRSLPVTQPTNVARSLVRRGTLRRLYKNQHATWGYRVTD